MFKTGGEHIGQNIDHNNNTVSVASTQEEEEVIFESVTFFNEKWNLRKPDFISSGMHIAFKFFLETKKR